MPFEENIEFVNAPFPDSVTMVNFGIEYQYGAKEGFKWESDPNDTPDDGIYLMQFSFIETMQDSATGETKRFRKRFAFTVRAVTNIQPITELDENDEEIVA